MVTYVRVKDVCTGHRYDVPSTDPRLRAGLLVPLHRRDYPDSSLPRPAKPKRHRLIP